MTDRRTLARALEEGRASRDAAEHIATEIYDGSTITSPRGARYASAARFRSNALPSATGELSVRYLGGGKWQWLVDKDGLATRKAP